MPKPRLLNNADLLEKEISQSSTATVELKQGLNTYSIENNAIATLGGVSGSTLVNILGIKGRTDTLDNVTGTDMTLSLSNERIKMSSSASTSYLNVGSSMSFSSQTYYYLLADIENEDSVSKVIGSFTGGNVQTVAAGQGIGKKTIISRMYVSSNMNASIQFIFQGAGSKNSYIKNIRCYQVSSTLYYAIGSLPFKDIENMMPYTERITPAKNPYAIRYGENLLPPFYEWGDAIVAGTPTIEGSYRFKMVKGSGTVGFSTLAVKVNAAPLTDYTLSIPVEVSNIGGTTDQGIYWNAAAYGEDGGLLQDFTLGPFVEANGTYTMGRSFKTPANTNYVRLVIGINNPTTGTAVFHNLSLCLGTTAKPFKPREDSVLGIQADLYADPLTGANADEVFEKDGQYFKLAKWRKVLADGNKEWALSSSETGVKVVYFSLPDTYNPLTWNPIGVKYNGSILTRSASGPDRLNGSSETPKLIVISVSSADSGWGDSYTNLTAEEIKAYFMGWRMYDGADATLNTPYTTGTKYWRAHDKSSWGYTSVPTTTAPNYTPYQLLYQLATPVVEPIKSEGALTLIAGSNQIEVGTGIVLRETTKPQTSDYGTYINSAFPGFEKTRLKHKTRKILTIFKNGKSEPSWVRNTLDAYGNERAVLSAYDPAAAYSVTYLILEKYPAIKINMSYPTSLKDSLNKVIEVTGEMKVDIAALQKDSEISVKGKGQRIETILYKMPYSVNTQMNSFTEVIFFEQAFDGSPLIFATFDSVINYEGVSISVQAVTSTSVVLNVKNLSNWDMIMPGVKIHILAVG